MHIIEVSHLTKDYGHGRGVFDVSIRVEKAKGHTVFMSSHIFEEIEEVCDKVAMIKDGKLIDTVDLWELRHWKTKTFHITFSTKEDYKKFLSSWNQIAETSEETLRCRVEMPVEDTPLLLQTLKNCSVASLRDEHITPNQYFTQIYTKGAY